MEIVAAVMRAHRKEKKKERKRERERGLSELSIRLFIYSFNPCTCLSPHFCSLGCAPSTEEAGVRRWDSLLRGLFRLRPSSDRDTTLRLCNWSSVWISCIYCLFVSSNLPLSLLLTRECAHLLYVSEQRQSQANYITYLYFKSSFVHFCLACGWGARDEKRRRSYHFVFKYINI